MGGQVHLGQNPVWKASGSYGYPWFLGTMKQRCWLTIDKNCHKFRVKQIFECTSTHVKLNVLTSWHDNTESLALWSLSPPIGGSDLEDVPISRCKTIYGG